MWNVKAQQDFIDDAIEASSINPDSYHAIIAVAPAISDFALTATTYSQKRVCIVEAFTFDPWSYGILCHELGHTLGMSDLYSGEWWYRLKTSMGDVGDWCLMGSGYDPNPLCSYSRMSVGWLKPDYIPLVILEPREKTIVDLMNLKSGDSVPIHTDPLIFPESYFFEARTEEVVAEF